MKIYPEIKRLQLMNYSKSRKLQIEKTPPSQIPVIYDFISNELEIQKALVNGIAEYHKKE